MQPQKPSAADARMAAMQEREKELQLVQSLCQGLLSVNSRPDFLRFASANLQEHIGYSQMVICVTDRAEKEYTPLIHTSDTANTALTTNKIPVTEGFFADAISSADPLTLPLFNLNAKKQPLPGFIQKAMSNGMREVVVFPLHHQENNPAVAYLFFSRPGMFSRPAQRLLRSLSLQLSLTVSGIIQNLNQGVNSLGTATDQIETESAPTVTNGLIIGNSPAINAVKQLIKTVAPTTTGVLLLGESGTGKEVIAAAIHEASGRRGKKMIKVNCAALPENLIESELFGHEKGSFTGAVKRKIGKFKLADQSTLFLDEIGELPLVLQTKLLRVLQESEFEPIGSSTTIKVNVRVIAATNRNLLKEVAEGRFRADLFYRLNVFPINLPALRDHREDIPALANYFIKEYCTMNKRKVLTIASKTLETMQLYPWPGNVRELKHCIERSILLCETGTITAIDFPEIKAPNTDDETLEIKPLHEIERAYILRAIKICNGRISGPNGAAIRLGLPHTTLISRMQKLGISKIHTSGKDKTS